MMKLISLTAFTTIATLLAHPAAFAQTATVNTAPPLTQESIQALYDGSIKAYNADIMSYKLFLTRSMHDTALSVSESYVTIPGREMVVSTDKMTKADMLASAEQNFNAMKGAIITHTLATVTIAPDGQTATVKDVTKIDKINMGGVFANAKGVCNDQLAATSVGPQIVISKCKADVVVELPAQ